MSSLVIDAVTRCLAAERERVQCSKRLAKLEAVGEGLVVRARLDDDITLRRARGGDPLAVELPDAGAELEGRPAPIDYASTGAPTITTDDLRDVVSAHAGGRGVAAVSDVRRLGGGFSKEMVRAEVSWQDGAVEELVVRKVNPGRRAEGLREEYDVLCEMRNSGVPVAPPRWYDEARLGAPALALAAVAGETRGDVGGWRAEPTSAEISAVARTLAAVHAADVSRVHDFPIPALLTSEHLAAAIAERRNVVTSLSAADAVPGAPLFAVVLDWLERNAPALEGPGVLVHGDYGPHNLMFDRGSVVAVLDWERAHPGHAAEDLAYARPTFTDDEWAQFIREYEASGGRVPSPAVLSWFGVWQDLWRAVSAYRMRAMFLASPDDVTYAISGLLLAPRFLANAYRQVMAA